MEADVPTTYKKALRSSDASAWTTAIKEELDNLSRLAVWEIRPVPPGVRVLLAKWVFARKHGADGSTPRFKARYVAKGYTQVAGEQFNGTFAPTATFVSMRLILAVAALNKWPVHTFDFVAAYLNSPIDEEVWVSPPEGLPVPPGHACLLKKALYGTKQAGRCWWQHLSSLLAGLGYVCSQYDGSIYILQSPVGNTAIWIHVDDGIVTGPSTAALHKLLADVSSSLEVKWADTLSDIVGLRISRNTSGFLISQPKLTEKILKEHWDGSSSSKTPLPTGNLPLTAAEGTGVDPSRYLSIIGSLSYLSAGSRPDITYAVNFLARFSKAPSNEHWKCLSHLLGYLAATRARHLSLFPNSDSPRLCCFADANWGGEFSRSTYGYIVLFHGCPIAWACNYSLFHGPCRIHGLRPWHSTTAVDPTTSPGCDWCRGHR
jgi:hypothetical protein